MTLRNGNIKGAALVESCSVPKGWGKEIIIENNEKYCGKVLVFKKGFKFSMHYHMIKDETWYVQSGEFIFKWIDTVTAKREELLLTPGFVVRIEPGQPHQLEALTDGEVLKFSNNMWRNLADETGINTLIVTSNIKNGTITSDHFAPNTINKAIMI